MTEVAGSLGPNALTAALVVSKTKCDSLQNIKNLNLWGNELEDLRLLRQMPDLQVVSLSVNCISTLREFSYCLKLQELYLRKNNIRDLKEIKYLTKLPQLKVLWLHDNPCAVVPNYREAVIKSLPNLNKLDNTPITPEERVNASKLNFTLDQKEQQAVMSHRHSRQVDSNQPLPLSQKKLNREPKQSVVLKPRPSIRDQPRYQRVLPVPTVSEKQKNILSAVMSLFKELDQNSLETARIELDRQLSLRRR